MTLAERAYRIRRNAVRMGAVQGQGYIAQALGVSDVLAVAYFHALRYRPGGSELGGRDRFCLSIGHYAIALYSVLIEAGVLPEDELETYGTMRNQDRLMSRELRGHGGASSEDEVCSFHLGFEQAHACDRLPTAR